ncbi:MAG: alcohol dehydrogenase, partial [Oxalobacteraceae bacterium]
VGIGGLGHLAIQFAAKRGCRVTALSSSPHKQRDALTLGANRFVDLSKSVDCKQVRNAFDYVLVTSAVACDWSAIVDMLRPFGVLCFAGMPPPVTFDVAAMMYKTLSITTANVGGRQDIQDTLAFAAARHVRPWVQSWPLEDVNHALRQLRKGRVHYRAVMQVGEQQVQAL